MKPRISEKIASLQSSQTVALSAQALEMKRKGEDIISLSAGEPDFPTPRPIAEAGLRAIQQGKTFYTAPQGDPQLLEAISKKLNRENHLSYSPDQIMVTCGAKSALNLALQVICNSGDEVLIPSPYWVSYPELVKLAGAKPVFLPTDSNSNFKVRPNQIRKKLNPKTKALLLCSPNNPTGAVYSKSELLDIAEALSDSSVFVISDEIYEKLIYDGNGPVSYGALRPELIEKTITVNGFSKSYAMTGWRIGYLAGPMDIIQAAIRAQGHMTHAPSTISQQAALTAIQSPPEMILPMVTAFEERRNFFLDSIKNQLEGVWCQKPEGAFYLFPNFSNYYNKASQNERIADSKTLCQFLLKTAGVAAVPGSSFGNDSHIRFSFATGIKQLEKATHRMAAALKKLR